MPDPAVQLEDVGDVRAFAAWRVGKSLGANGRLLPAQREDAVDEAVVMVFELHSGYDWCTTCGHRLSWCGCPTEQPTDDDLPVRVVAHRQGWDQARCARFSAYLMTYLDRALIDWWRRELRQSGRGTWSGSKGTYTYHGLVSLDTDRELTATHGAHRSPVTSQRLDSTLVVHPPE